MSDDHASSTPASPPPAPAPGHQPRRGGTDGFFAAIRRWGISRSSDRWVGGVAGGVAQRLGLDPLLVRGVLGVTVVMGFGLVLYGLAWALLPEESDGRIHLEEAMHGNPDIALLGAGAAVVVGAQNGGWLLGWGPFGSGWFRFLAWVAVLAVIVEIWRSARRGRLDRPRRTTQPYPAPAAAPAPAPGPRPAAAPAPAAPLSTSIPTAPPRPPQPVVHGPGAAVTGTVVALVLIGVAVLLLADRLGVYDGPIGAVALGGGVVLVGIAIVVSGLRGRSAGGLTALAIIGVLVALPMAAGSQRSWWDDGNRRMVADEDVTVTSRTEAAEGFSSAIGDTSIDLTEVPLTGGTLTVPISGGVGDITVVVPRGTAVRADLAVGIGDITWDMDGRTQSADGLGRDRTFRSDQLTDDEDPQLVLGIDLAIGSITIEEN